MPTTPSLGALLEAPLGREAIRQIYDRLGQRYDWLRFAESAPKRDALALLAVRPGERVVEVGVGTGLVLIELARSVAGASPAGTQPSVTSVTSQGTSLTPLVAGLDLSPTMLSIARARMTEAGLGSLVDLREGDASALPYADGAFDAAFSSYVLDLLPSADIGRALAEVWRVLRPGGRLALVALSPGLGPLARLFTGGYEALYRRRPDLLAGCRPIRLVPLVEAAGFIVRERREWFRGHPSEVVLAVRP